MSPRGDRTQSLLWLFISKECRPGVYHNYVQHSLTRCQDATQDSPGNDPLTQFFTEKRKPCPVTFCHHPAWRKPPSHYSFQLQHSFMCLDQFLSPKHWCMFSLPFPKAAKVFYFQVFNFFSQCYSDDYYLLSPYWWQSLNYKWGQSRVSDLENKKIAWDILILKKRIYVYVTCKF